MKKVTIIFALFCAFTGPCNLMAQLVPDVTLDTTFCAGVAWAIKADLDISNPVCPVLTNGTIHATLYANSDSIRYKLLNFNSTTVLDSGAVADSGIINFPSLVAGTYSLILSDSLCIGAYRITLYAPSPPNYTGNTFAPVCYGDSVSTGCINISGGTPPFNFTWSDPAITGICPANVPVGTYSLIVTDARNCTDTALNIIVRQSLPIVVNEIAAHPGLNSDSIALSITGGTPPYTVYWGDSSSSQTNDTTGHRYINHSIQYITIEDANSCTAYDTVATVYINGIPQNAWASMKLFPNPATDQLFIESNQIAMDEIEILDITGKQVLHQYLNSANQAILNISGISDGVYLLNVKSAGLEYPSRFVKAK